MADLSRQYASSLSILAISLFIGVPIWWKTTEVYRCPLPYKEIGKLSHKHVPPELVLTISISLLTDSEDRGRAVEPLLAQLRKELVVGSISARNTRVSIRYSIQSHILGSADNSELLSHVSSDDPEDFSNHFAGLVPSSIGHYYILLVPDSFLSHDNKHNGRWMEGTIFVSKHRHTIIRMKDEKDLSSSLADILKVTKSVYGQKKQLEKSLKSSAGISLDRVDVESMRELRPTQGYQLSFTLLNPDPSQLKAKWNIENVTNDMLVKFLDHPGISSLGNFTVSSQEFYYTDVKFHPRRDGNEFYILSTNLPPMISSVESKLASHVSQFPSLNFLVYIPKKSESPLFIRPSSSSSSSGRLTQTDNFLVPQWGGVIIYNPEEFSQSRSHVDSTGDGDDDGSDVNVKMEKLMPIFIQQLKMLLGFPDNPFTDNKGENMIFSSERHGISDWKVDQLLMGKLMESVSMATTSLISLVQLLDKVKNMVISDHIQHEVEYSLSSIQKCFSQASNGNLSASYLAAKQAMHSAEVAFFDPSILELLYFPDDQKFAIYIPLFLPISVPILFSSMAALKWIGTRVRGEKLDKDKEKKSKHSESETIKNDSPKESSVEKNESGAKDNIKETNEREEGANQEVVSLAGTVSETIGSRDDSLEVTVGDVTSSTEETRTDIKELDPDIVADTELVVTN